MTRRDDAPTVTRGEGAGGNREVPARCLPAGLGETWFPLWEAVDGRTPPAADRVLVGASRRAA